MDNAATFTTTNNDITNRTPTTTVVQWTASSVGTGSVVVLTWRPSFRRSSAGPAGVEAIPSPSSRQGARPTRCGSNAYDNGSGVFATLNITSVTGGNLTKQAMYYAAMRR